MPRESARFQFNNSQGFNSNMSLSVMEGVLRDSSIDLGWDPEMRDYVSFDQLDDSRRGAGKALLSEFDQIYVLCVQCSSVEERYPLGLKNMTTFFDGKKAFEENRFVDIGSVMKPWHNIKVNYAHWMMYKHASDRNFTRIMIFEDDVVLSQQWYSEPDFYESSEWIFTNRINRIRWPEESMGDDAGLSGLQNMRDFIRGDDWAVLSFGSWTIL